ncbi:uncharacterized protein LOC119719458 [Patiria miniata]|uniref:Integrase catalytic domain-containing protein n=1 Tax=Patiria miniata TaxID=46514 RepID=A0A913YZN1_PATMI|nr:uncharacterized protein LOC119719458 [Patiria miniata]
MLNMKFVLAVLLLGISVVTVFGVGRRAMKAETYEVIVALLKGTFVVPVRDRTKAERTALVRFWRNREKFSLAEDGHTLLFDGKRVVKECDLESIVKQGVAATGGGGARKLNIKLRSVYTGLSRTNVQKYIGKSNKYRPLKARLHDRATFRPITAKEVHARHQIDLIDLTKWAVEYKGVSYGFVLMVVDVFSQYTWLRAVEMRDSSIIAEHLTMIYLEHGPPRVIEHEGSFEFHQAVEQLMESLQVKVMISSPYYPQSQGKVERSQRIQQIMCDLIDCKKQGVNWVNQLPFYAATINEFSKEKLTCSSPFRVYYSRKNNRVGNPILVNSENSCGDYERRDHFKYFIAYDHSDHLDALQTQGLTIVYDPQPDGNCQFDALANQLQNIGIQLCARALRTEIVRDLRMNPTTIGGISLEEYVPDNDLNAYLEQMDRDGTHGDHLTLQRAARIYNVNIVVFSSLGPHASNILSPSGSVDRDRPIVMLGHMAEDQGEHYLSVQPANTSVFDFVLPDASTANNHTEEDLSLSVPHVVPVAVSYDPMDANEADILLPDENNQAPLSQRNIDYNGNNSLPREIIQKIILLTLKSDYSMLGTFNRVSLMFRELASFFHPQVYLDNRIIDDLNLRDAIEVEISVQRIISYAGASSRLALRLGELFSANPMWFDAWLIVSVLNYRRFVISDIFWK